MVVVPADGRSDCGFVLLGDRGQIEKFDEKQARAEGAYINAGIYLLSRPMLLDTPAVGAASSAEGTSSALAASGQENPRIRLLGSCIDIGTPERYNRAQSALADVETKVCVPLGSQR